MAKKRAARGNKEGTNTPIETALVAPKGAKAISCRVKK